MNPKQIENARMKQQLPRYANVLITVFISAFAVLILSHGFSFLWFNIENHKFAKELHQMKFKESEARKKAHEKQQKVEVQMN